MFTTPLAPDAPSDLTVADNTGPAPDLAAPRPVVIPHPLADDRLRSARDNFRTPTVFQAASELRVKSRIVWRCATELDARGRQPPIPLNAVRTAYGDLAPGEVIYVRTGTEPLDLITGVQRLGISASGERRPDGSWRTTVRRT